jgi:hypothetical protein
MPRGIPNPTCHKPMKRARGKLYLLSKWRGIAHIGIRLQSGEACAWAESAEPPVIFESEAIPK